MLNNFYGQVGSHSKVDQAIIRWAKDNDAVVFNYDAKNIFRIRLDKTCYPNYPPFDNFVVNFKTDELASSAPGIPSKDRYKYDPNWRATYGARCTKKK